jgi:hypothetical protein
MISVEELQAALNDPASPMREKLLQHLSMSPLDPAKAYQQIMESENPASGGLPMVNGVEQQSAFADMMTPQAPQNLSREANPTGVVNLANSAEVMPPTESLMPGESGGMPQAADGMGSFRSMLSGLPQGGQSNRRAQTTNPPAVAPRGNQWNPFTATQLQTPGVQRQPTLAELLGRR